MFWRASIFCCRVRVLGPHFFSHYPTSFILWGKGSPPDFVEVFLNIFNIGSFKEMFYTVHPKSRELNFSLLPWPWQLLPAPFSQEKSIPRCLLDSLRGGRWGKRPAHPSRTLVSGLNLMDLTAEVHRCRPGRWEMQRRSCFHSSLGISVRGRFVAVSLKWKSSSVLWDF